MEWNGWNLAWCTSLCQWVTLIDRWRLCHTRYDQLQGTWVNLSFTFNLGWLNIQSKGDKKINTNPIEMKYFIFYILFKIGEIRKFITNGTWYDHDTKLCLLPFPFPYSLISLESGSTLAFHLSLWWASYVILFLGGMRQTNWTKTNSLTWVQ